MLKGERRYVVTPQKKKLNPSLKPAIAVAGSRSAV